MLAFSMLCAGCLQPFLAIKSGRATGAGRGDGLAVVRIDDVAAGEDPLNIRGRAIIRQRVEQAIKRLDALPRQGGPGQEVALGCHGELAFEDSLCSEHGRWPGRDHRS